MAIKKPNKAMIRRAKNLAVGLIVKYQVYDPLDENEKPSFEQVHHRNPVKRISVKSMWRQFGIEICEAMVFRWLVTVHVVFKYPDAGVQREEIELEARCKLFEINDICMEQIKEAQRCGNHYSHTEFTIECIGI